MLIEEKRANEKHYHHREIEILNMTKKSIDYKNVDNGEEYWTIDWEWCREDTQIRVNTAHLREW